jgi:hypothetical protein
MVDVSGASVCRGGRARQAAPGERRREGGAERGRRGEERSHVGVLGSGQWILVGDTGHGPRDGVPDL